MKNTVKEPTEQHFRREIPDKRKGRHTGGLYLHGNPTDQRSVPCCLRTNS